MKKKEEQNLDISDLLIGNALLVSRVSTWRPADCVSAAGHQYLSYPTQQQTGMSKMWYLIVANGCSNVHRRSLIAPGVRSRASGSARLRTDGRLNRVSELVCSVTSASSRQTTFYTSEVEPRIKTDKKSAYISSSAAPSAAQPYRTHLRPPQTIP
jgi:hypothetical protein